MDSFQIVGLPSRRLRVDDGRRTFRGLAVVQIRFSERVASHFAERSTVVALRDRQSDANAWVAVHSDGRELVPELHLERGQTVPPWALR